MRCGAPGWCLRVAPGTHQHESPLLAQPLLAVHAAPFAVRARRNARYGVRTNKPRAACTKSGPRSHHLYPRPNTTTGHANLPIGYPPCATGAFGSAGTPACALCSHPAPGHANLPIGYSACAAGAFGSARTPACALRTHPATGHANLPIGYPACAAGAFGSAGTPACALCTHPATGHANLPIGYPASPRRLW
jgi:hypothetical protein